MNKFFFVVVDGGRIFFFLDSYDAATFLKKIAKNLFLINSQFFIY